MAGSTLATVAPAASADVPGTVRVLGSPSGLTDSSGNWWGSDEGFWGGRFSSPAPDRYIAGTSDQAIYRSNHIGMTYWGHGLPAGTYDLTLRFAEIYWTWPGARVFDVTAEGQTLLDNLDVYAAVGANTAYDRTFRVTVTDGWLDVGFSASVNLPMVSAIKVVPVDGSTAAPSSTPPAPAPAVAPAPPPPPAPSSSGRPAAWNTGVPDGTPLTPHWGDLTITTPGTHIDAMDLHGFLDIEAPDVTVSRSIIRGGWASNQRGLIHSTGARAVIRDSTLVPEQPSVYIDGLKGYGFTASRLDISGTVDTAVIYGNDTTIEDSWLHDNRHYLSDPAQGWGPSHDDSVQVQGGYNIRLRNNSLPGGWNTAVMVTQDYSVTNNLQISGNWLGGGGCTVNIAEKGRGPIQGLVLNGNRFDHTSRLDCAVIVPYSTPMSAWDNLWSDTLSPVRIRYN